MQAEGIGQRPEEVQAQEKVVSVLEVIRGLGRGGIVGYEAKEVDRGQITEDFAK